MNPELHCNDQGHIQPVLQTPSDASRLPQDEPKDLNWTIRAMHRYGGGFVKALANAFDHADDKNTELLCAAFPEYLAKYGELAQKLVDSTQPKE